MFFDTWSSIYKTILMTVIFYFSLIIMLRMSGKRTLADLNAFDMVVTISIGSIVATTILSKNTAYAEGLAAVGSLIILQYIVAKLSTKYKIFKKIIKASPTLVFYQGEYLEDNMKKMRITEEDILEEIRLTKGVTSDKINAVILETNGQLSVIGDISKDYRKEIEKY